jgi:hypothetical protein
MKTVMALIALTFSFATIAGLESGEFDCDNQGSLQIYKQRDSFYGAYLVFPSGSGRMSRLDSIELTDNTGVMFDDEAREIGKVEVLEDGNKIILNFNYSTVVCERI